jgi:hypothetical protein
VARKAEPIVKDDYVPGMAIPLALHVKLRWLYGLLRTSLGRPHLSDEECLDRIADLAAERLVGTEEGRSVLLPAGSRSVCAAGAAPVWAGDGDRRKVETPVVPAGTGGQGQRKDGEPPVATGIGGHGAEGKSVVPGRSGRFPSQTPHRPVRAGLPHTVLQKRGFAAGRR